MSTTRGFELGDGPVEGRVVGQAVLPAPPEDPDQDEAWRELSANVVRASLRRLLLGRSALPEAGGGAGIKLALEGRWHAAFPPPVTEFLRACTLKRLFPWNLTRTGTVDR